jgi:hypothetical protein
MTPSRPEYTKTSPQTGRSYTSCLKNRLELLFWIKPLTSINYNTFCENRFRIKNIFISGHFELSLSKVLGVKYCTPPVIRVRVK